jgi:2-polyprenyl-3-methyl-5-hydroxy-6-metoxy-1,4-benzoquinol methylase
MKIWTLEPLYQSWRINRIMPDMKYGGVLLDIGCDTPPRLINLIKSKMKRYIGIDAVARPHIEGNVEIKQLKIEKKIEMSSSSVEVITMLALLEHLKYPQEIVAECFRVLKPGGILLTTTPSPACKPLAELLANVGLLRKEMIEQHENYFTVNLLKNMAREVGFKKVEVSLFELGLNTFLKATK